MIKIFTQHRYLLWQFTRRQIEQRHRGSALGILWSVLQPLLMMSIYTMVFGFIFKGRYSAHDNSSTMDYALGVFLSITLFQVVAEILGSSPSVIVNQPNLVKKVVFPLEILPLANLGATFYQLCISLVLVLLGVMCAGDGLRWHSLYIFVVILPLVPMCAGLGLLLSSLGVFLRDIQHAIGAISLILMYASAVFYSATMIPPGIWRYMKYNPLIHIIDQARAVLLWHERVDWKSLGYCYIFSILLLGLGLWSFRKLKPTFADVI